MHLHSLLDPFELGEMMEQQFVREQFHPTEPLAILNYTDKAMIFNVWNDVTKTTRGLIYNTDNGEIVARPFPKFFNYGQAESKTYQDDEPVKVYDKLDGSLGILYQLPTNGDWAIATRGSFTSDQALKATEIWNKKYSGTFAPQPNETMLFEIIYPENRIVVDYGAMTDLVLLGGIDHDDGFGFSVEAFHEWSGPKAEEFAYSSLAEALAAPPRPGKEGLVVHFRNTETRVKIKQEDYLILHKIVTGLNEHSVWEHIQKDWLVHDLLESLPDEFHQWVIEVSERMFGAYWDMENEVLGRFDALNEAGLVSEERKEFALAIKDLDSWLKSALFLMLDNKDFSKILWKQVEPKKDTFVR